MSVLRPDIAALMAQASSRTHAPGQRSIVRVVDLDAGTDRVIHESSDVLLEAPNWSASGNCLLLNGEGGLWSIDLDDGTRTELETIGLPPINNDHVLSADGAHLYLSAADGHIYRTSRHGGPAARITSDTDPGPLRFLHGVSADETVLAYVTLDPEGGAPASVVLVPLDGTPSRVLSPRDAPADGCEFSPDGEWIYFNTEHFGTSRGHAQIVRVRLDGSVLTQLTRDDRVNWFPHLSANGSDVVYLSYPAGTEGHPADLDVEIRLVTDDDWSAPRTVAAFFGGQGSLNVHSWHPSLRRFAYVEYPVSAPVD